MTKRRDVVKALAVAPVAALTWTRMDVELAVLRTNEQPFQSAKFFSPAEWKEISVLVDDLFPKDEMGDSATAAKVPEFMDFMLNDGNEGNRTNMRAGLNWLNQESQKRFGKLYADAAQADRFKILDDISYPAKAAPAFTTSGSPFPPATGRGAATTPVTWFNSVRNLAAAGYFSSRVGYKAIGYVGGVAMPRWQGSSPEIMKKLGLSYDEWDKKYGRGF
ncbi:MAG TPA: gluconate 2-dehydrogenase subunit 3 family protein [Gemmatimonadaceae bacterium]|nr:gluconate 2-dehydrogenase subunit 3 family protein [Gemmatimonadaceae bacterium]